MKITFGFVYNVKNDAQGSWFATTIRPQYAVNITFINGEGQVFYSR